MSIKGRDILMIDDDPSITALVGKVLENVGLLFRIATGLEQAFYSLRVQIPHLIILDLMLGNEESGLTFLERRRLDPQLNAIPVIILSAVKEKKVVNRALSYEGVDYLLKPLNAKLLLQRVRKNLLGVAAKRVVFADEDRPAVLAQIDGQVESINEVSCTVLAGMKMQVDAPVKIKSSFFENFFGDNVQFITMGQSEFVEDGQFRARILFRGITEEQARKIRLAKWKK
ncbi:MAG: hypothetical protein A2504_02960 [Bdellovibrionales bacterium RIFOXYD12_FULL_39_22]|nr:MAG: hypothetical protein A2385_05675 [Bdellovibrionales bacterium RIFOXYB1_FULL_39_21]OFZ42242.1 MAG: hypothetical protein A2485_15705 [Bdellovibrionales bacterium RIFOXYC12_FULL_39_17]OFZ46666.1 MAG: hypothetical protein A2404_03965 [Bdellovibrionales bacterium RIFOXYC1_FULL_39_130]OFZ71757.1 MAG: hypothetical protein A2451_08310 [Bdellovibrionales bacterium RIFOXYC2_FULL_39_8]OFZ76057.1 MAG: hypothetical protein A2560_03185 [Bdellovibrionales bacterium RIFOXYD1_FULL_39_84]OFZ93041.1 MAG: